jgi:hypothetical protein
LRGAKRRFQTPCFADYFSIASSEEEITGIERVGGHVFQEDGIAVGNADGDAEV